MNEKFMQKLMLHKTLPRKNYFPYEKSTEAVVRRFSGGVMP